MASFMRQFDSETYALMRIVVGSLFVLHGSQKVLGFPLPQPEAPAFILYGAGLIELVGGGLVAVGFFTRWAAFLCSGLMAFAYWMAHGTKGFFPTVNGGELAVLFCFIFLFISAKGPGKWSVDSARG